MVIIEQPQNIKIKCAICNEALDLNCATIGSNAQNGEPILVHEHHKHDFASWVIFWAKCANEQVNNTSDINAVKA